MHTPVLLQEVLEALDLKPGKFIIDGTLGSGGHAREIIKRVAPAEDIESMGTFLGVDRDIQAITAFTDVNPKVKIFTRHSNYSNLPKILSELDLPKADGLLLDLGFSSDQLKEGSFAGRGFSFQSDEPLLMNYDDEARPLKEIIKELSEPELAKIIEELGEERYSRKIAGSVWKMTRQGKMETTQDLVRAVVSVVPKNYENGRIHPATRTFQALRIYVNGELEHLKLILENLDKVVRPSEGGQAGGRVAIISFHSLEDRIVKNYFRDMVSQSREEIKGKKDNVSIKILTKKPIIASESEILANPRSRSAKLRVIQL
ncbi:MAG: 16S rRNA (cytosine(1402)-N(4))-methyltransferase RsmH [Janthinobacterium sp.]|jgi:16S rRNA (cytosine1402-N4)-methyltransferase